MFGVSGLARASGRLGLFATVGFLTAFGCSSDSKPKECVAGSEACSCYPNKTCDEQLECLSGVCVDLGSAMGGASSGTGGRAGATGGTGNGHAGSDAGGTGSEAGGVGNGTGGMGTDAGGAGTDTGGSVTGGSSSDPGGAGADAGGAESGTGGVSTGGVSTGGTATGSGGVSAGGASTGGASTGTGGAPEVSDAKIIDNMSSCDGKISRVAGRDGFWYMFGDKSVNVAPNTGGASPAPSTSTPPTAFSQSTCAAWITGGCAVSATQCAFGGMGFTFKADESEYDVSAYQGITVDMEGDEIWAIVFMSQGRTFGTTLAASPGVKATRTLRFANLVVSGETPVGTAKDFTQVIKVEFTTKTPSGFGNAIWDVRFF